MTEHEDKMDIDQGGVQSFEQISSFIKDVFALLKDCKVDAHIAGKIELLASKLLFYVTLR